MPPGLCSAAPPVAMVGGEEVVAARVGLEVGEDVVF
jgi:hypothetical protein